MFKISNAFFLSYRQHTTVGEVVASSRRFLKFSALLQEVTEGCRPWSEQH